jgi:hypothetical protein
VLFARSDSVPNIPGNGYIRAAPVIRDLRKTSMKTVARMIENSADIRDIITAIGFDGPLDTRTVVKIDSEVLARLARTRPFACIHRLREINPRRETSREIGALSH